MWSHFSGGLLFPIAHMISYPVLDTLAICCLLTRGDLLLTGCSPGLLPESIPQLPQALHLSETLSCRRENVIEHECEPPIRQPSIKPPVLADPTFIQFTKNMIELIIQRGILCICKNEESIDTRPMVCKLRTTKQ